MNGVDHIYVACRELKIQSALQQLSVVQGGRTEYGKCIGGG